LRESSLIHAQSSLGGAALTDQDPSDKAGNGKDEHPCLEIENINGSAGKYDEGENQTKLDGHQRNADTLYSGTDGDPGNRQEQQVKELQLMMPGKDRGHPYG
jgi:hypothetical protein